MKKQKIILQLIIVLCFTLRGNAQENMIIERVVLQTDKELYVAGEDIWYSVSTVTQYFSPLVNSNIVYVELLGEEYPVSQHYVKLNSGKSYSNISLPVGLPTGNYRLVAYTRYNRNDEGSFVEKIVSVINPLAGNRNVTIKENREGSTIERGNLEVRTNRDKYGKRQAVVVSISGLPAKIFTGTVSVASSNDIIEREGLNARKSVVTTASVGQDTAGFLAELDGHEVRGTIVTDNSVPEFDPKVNNPLLSFIGDQIHVVGGKPDGQGRVAFPVDFYGTKEIAISNINPMYDYRIDLEPVYASHEYSKTGMPEIIESSIEGYVQRNLGIQAMQAMGVTFSRDIDRQAPLLYEKPDWSGVLAEFKQFPTMRETLIECVPGIRIKKGPYKEEITILSNKRNDYRDGYSMMLVDGVPLNNQQAIFDFSPRSIERIDVYRERFYFGSDFYDGVISFITKDKNLKTVKTDRSVQVFDYEGLTSRKILDSPVYSRAELPTPDFRSTLYWEPDLATASSPETIEFYTSDIADTYIVRVQGIDMRGNIFYGETAFVVE